MKKFINRNWIWLLTGLILTRRAVEAAYVERGYVAFGGEWLILPVMLMLVEMARWVANSTGIPDWKEDESGADID